MSQCPISTTAILLHISFLLFSSGTTITASSDNCIASSRLPSSPSSSFISSSRSPPSLLTARSRLSASRSSANGLCLCGWRVPLRHHVVAARLRGQRRVRPWLTRLAIIALRREKFSEIKMELRGGKKEQLTAHSCRKLLADEHGLAAELDL
ncbi:uncharacterized protein LAJ45_03490 [Morchella importuna]|uniref:uncharacterized protein n=1 Tax=Morchella importuna TaxID=1174673 RepID=UPI001E8E07C9|nr:uncharacterized protein LAJ45_03490 [Morchella importuna]KAH8152649.1 hypothetical protein LAJ45_03490 [Morchella importuna]